MKKHIFVHTKTSMRQNFEIKQEKIGSKIYFKKIKKKKKIFLHKVKKENFPI